MIFLSTVSTVILCSHKLTAHTVSTVFGVNGLLSFGGVDIRSEWRATRPYFTHKKLNEHPYSVAKQFNPAHLSKCAGKLFNYLPRGEPTLG